MALKILLTFDCAYYNYVKKSRVWKCNVILVFFFRVRVYDYQGVCKDLHGHRSAANFLLTPLRYMKWFVQWMVGRASWVLLQTQVAHLINPDWAYAMEQEQQDYHYEENDAGPGRQFYSITFGSCQLK